MNCTNCNKPRTKWKEDDAPVWEVSLSFLPGPQKLSGNFCSLDCFLDWTSAHRPSDEALDEGFVNVPHSKNYFGE